MWRWHQTFKRVRKCILTTKVVKHWSISWGFPPIREWIMVQQHGAVENPINTPEHLNTLPPGCLVMVNRVFDITEDLKTLGVELVIPCFKGRGRSQMTRMEYESSDHVAEARIHVNNCPCSVWSVNFITKYYWLIYWCLDFSKIWNK